MRQKEHSEPEELTETAQAVKVGFSGQEYRGRQALCAGLRDGNPHLVKDEVPWRVEGGSPIGSRVKRLAQGKLMPASTYTGYYLTQNFAGLAALPPSPAQNIFAGRRKNV